jgi:Domain of unknown function (DUF4396)
MGRVNLLGTLSLMTGVLCCLWIAIDEFRRPQKMAIMNVVWPVTALYAGPLGILAYYRLARQDRPDRAGSKPSPATVLKGLTHCGAGCTLGDLTAEALLLLAPSLALLLGWRHLWQEEMFSAWILDFLLAFAFGIAFQYFSIRPTNPHMARTEALRRALKADSLSLTAWQIGMYSAMALAHFVVFPDLVGEHLTPGSIAFWWGHAIRDAGTPGHVLSGQSLAHSQRHQGSDVTPIGRGCRTYSSPRRAIALMRSAVRQAMA